MKNLPESSRPYEKCMAKGPECLSDDELLAVILRTGTKGEQVIGLARKVLTLTGADGDISHIMDLSLPQLKSLKGIGNVKAIQIQCIGELSRRIWRSCQEDRLDCTSSASIASYYRERMRHETREMAIIVMLDTKGRKIHDYVLSLGSVNETVVSPREALCECLKFRAAGMILLHNHPSGDPNPSSADILTTNRMRQAGNLVGIPLMDHIIIGNQSYTSFRENWMQQEL